MSKAIEQNQLTVMIKTFMRIEFIFKINVYGQI